MEDKIMKKLIMFVLVFSLSASAFADDLNPPDWAGAPGTIYGIWGFDDEAPSGDIGDREDYPEEGAMVPHDTHPDPEEFAYTSDTEGAHQYMFQGYTERCTWLETYQGREGVLSAAVGWDFEMYNFEGSGTKLIRLQITSWPGGAGIEEFWIDQSNGPEVGPIDPDDLLVAEIADVGDGWTHRTYEYEIGDNPSWEGIWIGVAGEQAIDQIVIDTICYPGVEPPVGPGRPILDGPIIIEPNVMLVYETDETQGDFGVSLRNEPPSGATITVTVDPNDTGDGANEDITLIDGAGEGNVVTFSFSDSNWDAPQTVTFKAIDDEISEPPNLLERQNILVSSSWPEHPADANYVGETLVKVEVMDNDQANILFSVTPPIQLKEEPKVIEAVTVGVTLQVAPSGGPVKIFVTSQGGDGNPPIMDPPLTPESDPNSLIFNASNYNIPQEIDFLGNDDEVLQIEEAFAEGDQNYQAEIVFTVVDDGGDTRYAGLERILDVNIEDNECGAFGFLDMDIANSNGEALPDCYVDIYDMIELITQWLDCSDIKDSSCESYL
jgi:hypothetical protein